MRRCLAAIYFIAVFLVGCQPPGPKALLEGEAFISAGDYAQAAGRLETAVKLLPENAQAWNHLGLAYQYAGRPNEALKAYQQALSLDRNLPAIRFNLGTLHLEQNRLDEAMSELTTATVLQPGSAPAWVALGKAQLRAKRIDDAERTFATVVRLDQTNVEGLNYQGVVQLHRRRARDAMAYFNAALKQQPDYAPAVLNQAILYQHYIVNKTNALAKYREYLALRPDAAGAAAASEGVRVLETELAPKVVVAAPITNAPPVVTNRAVILAVRTNAPVAIATNPPRVTNIVQVASNKPVVTNIVSAPSPAPPTNKPVAIVTNTPPPPKLVTNSPPIEVVVKTNVPAPKTNVVVTPAPTPAITNAPAKEPERALEIVKLEEEIKIAAAKDAPEPAPAKKVEQPKPAAPVAKTPEVVATKVQTNAAPSPLIRPVQAEEKKSSTLLQKANPLNWFKRDKEGKEEPKTVAQAPASAPKADLRTLPETPKEPEIQAKPEPVYPRYPYQSLTHRAGDRAAAEAPFNEAVQAHQENKLGKAMDGYRRAIALDRRFFEAHFNLGLAALAASDVSLALASLEDAVRIDPKNIEARYQFAIALRRGNYPLDAVNELKTVTEDDPREARAYLALGNLYAQVLNKPEQAATNYRRLLELAPQHPQAQVVRGWLAQQ